MAQVSLSIADLGSICIHLSSFLRSSEVARSEEAGICSKDVARFLWRKAAMAHLAHIPIWGPSGNFVIQQLLDSGVQGKAFLRELLLLRRAVFPPKSWCPAIQETSFSNLKAARGTAGLGSAAIHLALCAICPIFLRFPILHVAPPSSLPPVPLLVLESATDRHKTSCAAGAAMLAAGGRYGQPGAARRCGSSGGSYQSAEPMTLY